MKVNLILSSVFLALLVGLLFGPIGKPEWVSGALLGGGFGVGSVWSIIKLVSIATATKDARKSDIVKWVIIKLLILSVSLFLVFKMAFFQPLGFILGYGCVILAIILGSTFKQPRA